MTCTGCSIPRTGTATDLEVPGFCGVSKKSAFAAHFNQPFVPELFEMVRKRRIRDIQSFLDLSNNQALRVCREEYLHDPQSGLCTHCGEHVGVLCYFFSSLLRLAYGHISMFAEISLTCQTLFPTAELPSIKSREWMSEGIVARIQSRNVRAFESIQAEQTLRKCLSQKDRRPEYFAIARNLLGRLRLSLVHLHTAFRG